MGEADDRTLNRRLREHAERDLSALVIAIEFTLISVIVGVILFPLMDNATPLLRDLQYEYWLYIVGGLLFILLLWTQVISHSLSFVGWPINIWHNLLYIVFALVLGIQMHFLSDPRGWFAVSLVSALVSWLLIHNDAQVIRERMAGASGSALDLFQVAQQRQQRLMGRMTIAFADSVLNLALLILLPQFFIERPGHLLLIALQSVFVFLLTASTIRVFKSWSEPMVRKAAEELASEGEH